jgi:hypothetical protein
LGMSSSIALWLEPLGNFLTVAGIGIMLGTIYYQLRLLTKSNQTMANNV